MVENKDACGGMKNRRGFYKSLGEVCGALTDLTDLTNH